MSPALAFYAPLKPPDHPNPSGDRLLARLLMQALAEAGFEVRLASRLRSRDANGDPVRQQRLDALGQQLAERLLRRWRREGWRPQIWFTYHLYYKAPDWIGPRVCEALDIPYVAAEASWAGSRATGPWARSHRSLADALKRAQRLFTFNPTDIQGLKTCLGKDAPIVALPPFLDLAALPDAAGADRAALAAHWNLDPALPWLISVAMMRPGDKLASYRQLARAMQRLASPCQLLLVGDGSARAEVAAAFAGDARVRLLGQLAPSVLMPLLAACELMVWPAVNEAFGMALLEAQALGVPVLAGREGGVAAVVHDGVTGQLVPPGDAAALAAAVDRALSRPQLLQRWRGNCAGEIGRYHSLTAAAQLLRRELEPLIDA